MNYDIESKLGAIKTTPMTETEKNTMWQKIEMEMNAKTISFLGSFRTRVRASIAFTLAVLVAGSGVAFAYADSARPGDVLFPLGVAREKVEIFLAPESKKNDLRVKFAEKRIEDGQVFLTLLVKAKGAFSVSYASSTATSTNTTGASASTTATTTTTANSITEDATRRFNATIAYLEKVKADLLKNGDTFAAGALENAIDAMIAQARQIPTNDSSVLVKIKDNANKFKMDVRIANSTTTTKIAFEQKNNEHGNSKKDDREDKGTTITIVKETFSSKIFHKKEEKKEKEERRKKHEDRDDNEGKNKHDDDQDEDDDEDDDRRRFFDRFGKKAVVCHISDGRKKTISVGKKAVQAHLAHGDTLGKCGGNGTATTTPDTTAPTISAFSATGITAGAATISWITNESATGKIRYATTSPLSNVLENTAFTLSHSFNLTGLTASTTYHYIVSSTDSAGNATSSAELIFATN